MLSAKCRQELTNHHMTNDEFILGHEPIIRRINVRREVRRIAKNPLDPFIRIISGEEVPLFSNDVTRYLEGYWFYYLSFERYLKEMSIAARYHKGPYWISRSGGSTKFTPIQRRLADQRRQIARYLEYDLVNCLIHSRVLLDRTVGLAHHFLTGQRLPSFTSFDEHKKFFCRVGNHGDYGEYIRTKTDWFEMPLKIVRDKFIVHASPKHIKFMGYPAGEWALDFNIILPNEKDVKKPLSKVGIIRVNALRLSLDIETFLTAFNEFGVRHLSSGTKAEAVPGAASGASGSWPGHS